MQDKAKLVSMSYRRQGPFKQAEGSNKWKHSAKDMFLCDGQFTHVTCYFLQIRTAIEPVSGRLELKLWYLRDVIYLNHSYNKPAEEHSLS